MFTLILWNDRGYSRQIQQPSYKLANDVHKTAAAMGIHCVIVAPGTDLEFLSTAPCPAAVQ